MAYDQSGRRNGGLARLTALTANGLFVAGMIFIATPVLAQNTDPGDNNEGCGKGAGGVEGGPDTGKDFEPGSDKCKNGVPAPLAAAGIPALAILGGGYIAVRKRRRDSNPKS